MTDDGTDNMLRMKAAKAGYMSLCEVRVTINLGMGDADCVLTYDNGGEFKMKLPYRHETEAFVVDIPKGLTMVKIK